MLSIFRFLFVLNISFHGSVFASSLLNDNDNKEIFHKIRKEPANLGSSDLKRLLDEAGLMFPILNKGLENDVFRKSIHIEKYYFILLSRHNLSNENLSKIDLKVELISKEHAGITTILHYKLKFIDSFAEYNFWTLYINQNMAMLNKIFPKSSLEKVYNELVEKINKRETFHNFDSKVLDIYQIEQEKDQKSEQSSLETKSIIENYYIKSPLDTQPPQSRSRRAFSLFIPNFKKN
jgi:hypothetical protein